VSVEPEPRLERIESKQLIGASKRMSLAADATPALWAGFMPRRNEIQNRIGSDLIGLRTFEVVGADMFAPQVEFEKFALAEVTPGTPVPAGMLSFTLPAGEYAVFIHHGPASAAPQTFGYIYGQWLPQSDFELDPRPQFEILPEGYNPMDPNAHEEIWIPIKAKT